MKKVVFVFILTIAVSASKAQSLNSKDKQSISMLSTFYKGYLSAFFFTEPGHNFEHSLVKLRKKYLTARCQRQFKKLILKTDSDPIINGQDVEPKWAETLSIKRNFKHPNLYTISFSNVNIALCVIKQQSNFKIDYIQ